MLDNLWTMVDSLLNVRVVYVFRRARGVPVDAKPSQDPCCWNSFISSKNHICLHAIPREVSRALLLVEDMG